MAWHNDVYKRAAIGSKIGAQRRMIREERRRAVSSIYHIVEKLVFVGTRREVDRLFSPALLSKVPYETSDRPE